MESLEMDKSVRDVLAHVEFRFCRISSKTERIGMNIEDTLSSLKRKIDSINTKKIENATKLHGLEEEKIKLLQECQALGVDPAGLEKIVVDEETKLNSEIAKLESEIGQVYDSISKF